MDSDAEDGAPEVLDDLDRSLRYLKLTRAKRAHLNRRVALFFTGALLLVAFIATVARILR